jgi:phospholipid/cholesterol/gamma-HCH transport system substrate-binding protein
MMAFMSKEAKVGIFVLLGIIILAYFTLKVGKIEVTEKGYTIYADFDTISGLDDKSVVKMAGVPVGQVLEIGLEGNRARVRMKIRERVKIPMDSTIALASEGMIGEKHIEIYPGLSKESFIEEGGTIEKSYSGANIDELIRKVTLIADDFKKITESLTEVLADEEGKSSLKEIIGNLRDSTRIFKDIFATNEDKIGRIFENLDRISGDLEEVTGERKEDLKVLIANLKEFTDILKEKTPEIVRKLDSTLGKIERGEGTLGKLVSDSDAYDNMNSALEGINRQIKKVETLQTFLDYRLEYQEGPSEFKQYASLKIQPTVDKYYLFGIVDDPVGDVETKTIITTQTPPGITTQTEETVVSDDLKFNAFIAKKFGDFTFRAGLMESTAGFGFSYFALRNRLALNFDLFDFDRANNDPHVKFYGNYSIFKNLFVTAGYDDFINDNNDFRTLFFGFGLEFRDDDLKTLLRATPPVSP